jgi:hypothetical protein
MGRLEAQVQVQVQVQAQVQVQVHKAERVIPGLARQRAHKLRLKPRRRQKTTSAAACKPCVSMVLLAQAQALAPVLQLAHRVAFTPQARV